MSVSGAPVVPKVDALLVLPCDDRTLLDRHGRALSYASRVCRPLLSGYFWLEEPTTLVLGVKGGTEQHVAQSGDRTWVIPPGRVTPIRIPVPSGSSQVQLQFEDLELPLGYPDIVSARLEGGGVSRSLL